MHLFAYVLVNMSVLYLDHLFSYTKEGTGLCSEVATDSPCEKIIKLYPHHNLGVFVSLTSNM